LRTQRAFFNAALALLGMVEGIYDVRDLCFGLIARLTMTLTLILSLKRGRGI
jgi:hypothetical protein